MKGLTAFLLVLTISVGCSGRTAAAACAEKDQTYNDRRTMLGTEKHGWTGAPGTEPTFEDPDVAKLWKKFDAKYDRLVAECNRLTKAEFRSRADK